MSIKLMPAAWELELPASDKIVLLALADWANDDGHCWPSMAQLVKKSGMTDRAIRAIVGRLVDAGHLSRREVMGKGVNYFVHPGTSFRGESNSGGNKVPQTPEPRSANTSGTTKPQKATPSSDRRAKSSLPDCPSFANADSWQAFWEMRKAKGVKATPGAVARIITKLDRWQAAGHDPNEILDRSITSNWTDVYEPKEPRNVLPARPLRTFEKPAGFRAFLADEEAVGWRG